MNRKWWTLLMAGLDGSSGWTHLAAGFVVAGIGSGLVNPPLASTAVGVVAPQRSGMASVVNTTFRQLGMAVSVAAFGTLFTASFRHAMTHNLAGNPSLACRVPSLVTAVHQGQIGRTIGWLPASGRAQIALALHAAFASALNNLLVVSGVVALVGAMCSVLLIRSKDFVSPAPPPAPTTDPACAQAVGVAAGRT